MTITLISGIGEQNNIKKIIEFFNTNQGLSSVGAGEFIVASYMGNQLTTFYDTKTGRPAYVTYLHNSNTGEEKSSVYQQFDTAVYFFVTQTQMIDLKKFAVHESFSERMRRKVIDYLLSKSNQKAEQR